MGLLDRFERMQAVKNMPKNIQFEYESMDKDTREKIVHFFKRLFIRGTLGKEEEYSSDNNICVRDKANEIICFNQGGNEEQKYFGLFIKDEMWCVTAVIDKNAEKVAYKDVEVIYIPSKIGKVSNENEMALSIAHGAIYKLGGEPMEDYIDSLRGVLSEESVLEYTKMKSSWYEQLFEDENCKQLLEYQKSKFKEKEAEQKTVIFEYEVVDRESLEAYNGVLKDKIKSSTFVFNPKVCVAAKDDNIRCFKYLKKIDFANITDIQYYVMLINAEIVLIGAVETREIGAISIEKITTLGVTEYNNEILRKLAMNAIAKIQEIWYNKPSVRCADAVHTEKYTYDKNVEI